MGIVDTKVKVAGKTVGEYDIVPNPWIEEVYDDDGNLIAVELHGHKKIRDNMFDGHYSLTSITIPNSVTSIGSYAFSDCSGLTTITIPKNVTSIKDGVFGGCRGLTTISIPDSVTTIGNSAFNSCSGLTTITIPNSVTSIGGYAFGYCTNLNSVIFKSKPSGTIDKNTFRNCTNLTDIKVPWAKGAVANAPWGATNATITYNYVGE